MHSAGKRRPKIKGKLVIGQSTKKLISLKAGGIADFFAMPDDLDDLKAILMFCKEESKPFLVMGNGSKLLVRDEGFRGIIVKLGSSFKQLVEEGDEIKVGAGVDLSVLIDFAADKGLSGLECLTGIPGTVGGGIVRNVSAFGECISNRVTWVKVLDRNNSHLVMTQKNLNFGYRTSTFFENKNLVLLEVGLKLFPEHKAKINARMQEATRKKLETQPISFSSAGCIFKNPSSQSAGYLIEQSGCLGMKIGGAQVSFQHGNFIINTENAGASDILNLIDKIKKIVRAEFGITLEPELEIV